MLGALKKPSSQLSFAASQRVGCQTLKGNQFLVLSTNLFFAIQGIMARNCEPTFSIECSAVSLRRAVMLG
jgi:hypothetical protein